MAAYEITSGTFPLSDADPITIGSIIPEPDGSFVVSYTVNGTMTYTQQVSATGVPQGGPEQATFPVSGGINAAGPTVLAANATGSTVDLYTNGTLIAFDPTTGEGSDSVSLFVQPLNQDLSVNGSPVQIASGVFPTSDAEPITIGSVISEQNGSFLASYTLGGVVYTQRLSAAGTLEGGPQQATFPVSGGINAAGPTVLAANATGSTVDLYTNGTLIAFDPTTGEGSDSVSLFVQPLNQDLSVNGSPVQIASGVFPTSDAEPITIGSVISEQNGSFLASYTLGGVVYTQRLSAAGTLEGGPQQATFPVSGGINAAGPTVLAANATGAAIDVYTNGALVDYDPTTGDGDDEVQLFVAPVNGYLFSKRSDAVDFNNLTSDQQTAVQNGADLYNGLGGSDKATLPSVSSYNETIGVGATLGWDATQTFNTGSVPETFTR